MQSTIVIIGFVQCEGKILLLKRADSMHYYPGKWQMVSGHLESKETAEDTVLREVKEETGLSGKITKSGKTFEYVDGEKRWIIVPFIIEVDTDVVTISKEHSAHAWILPSDYEKYDCLPGMKGDLESVGLI